MHSLSPFVVELTILDFNRFTRLGAEKPLGCWRRTNGLGRRCRRRTTKWYCCRGEQRRPKTSRQVSERSERPNEDARARLRPNQVTQGSFVVTLTISLSFTRFLFLWHLALRARCRGNGRVLGSRQQARQGKRKFGERHTMQERRAHGNTARNEEDEGEERKARS